MVDLNHHKVICFGEILWDILPSGPVPGGAPMNVAYHLHKLEKNPALITKIGLDESGKELIDMFSKQGVCTDFFQVDFDKETGKVFAILSEHNEVIYDIVTPAAWDYIEWEESYYDLISNASYFIYGSLAARNSGSKKTLDRLLEIAKNKVLDINLRTPHYNRRIVEELIAKADLLKLNIAELELITGWFSKYTSIEDRVRAITDKFNLTKVLVTRGGDGALFFNGQTFSHPGFQVPVADTVGSGDAFLAGFISKSLDGSTPEEALEFASGMGGFIATQTGACPKYTIDSIDFLIKEKIYQKAI